jgi:hypothetical protein
MRKVAIEGILIVSDSEGGFGPDDIDVGGRSLSEIVAEAAGLETDGRVSLGAYLDLGPVRLTIEPLDPGAEGT